jgi:hypothetical protein
MRCFSARKDVFGGGLQRVGAQLGGCALATGSAFGVLCASEMRTNPALAPKHEALIEMRNLRRHGRLLDPLELEQSPED